RRWSDEATAAGAPPSGRDHDVVAGLLAALALALDQRRPGYVTQLLPRPAAALGHQLVEMLQTELLRAWSESSVPAQPAAILGTLNALELARGVEELADRAVTPFSIAELFESIQGIVRPLAEEKGLALRFRGPEVDRRLGHPVALSRVLLNLTTNSIKFTEQGFVEIAGEDRPGGRAVFSVQDTGPGVNPEALSSLFQPFRRAPGRGGYCFSGTGLGLAICRKLVEAQGSTLRLETRPGWGTRFFFELELPAHAPALAPAPAPSPATARVP